MLALMSIPLAHAQPPTSVLVEIHFLLGYVEGSGCEFNRNGTWYDSRAAQMHLRDKFNYLAAGNLTDTTEAFIENAATQSSLTGQAYTVRCAGGATMTSNRWLRDELARLRRY